MQENHVRVCADDPSQIARCSQPIKVFNKMQHIIIHSHQDAKKIVRKVTSLLLPSSGLVTNFDGTHGENYGNNEK